MYIYNNTSYRYRYKRNFCPIAVGSICLNKKYFDTIYLSKYLNIQFYEYTRHAINIYLT